MEQIESIKAREADGTSAGELASLALEAQPLDAELARRQANQAKYAAFQEREKGANSAIRLLQLADAVMAELDDKPYAHKLLADAERRLRRKVGTSPRPGCSSRVSPAIWGTANGPRAWFARRQDACAVSVTC